MPRRNTYSAAALLRHGLTGQPWPANWGYPDPKSRYDVVIIGAGGHGLATAYYLAATHGITDVCVIERGWLGGGNTGRNTTIVRSNYFYPQSVALYDLSVRLYEDLSRDLNYNIMFSQRGVLTLAHTRHDEEMQARWSNALQISGVKAEQLSEAEVRERVPLLGPQEALRHPIRGGLFQPAGGIARHDAVAWAYARQAHAMGVDIVQRCDVEAITTAKGEVTGVRTSRGDIIAERVVICASAHSGLLAETAGVSLPITTYTLQAAVTEPLQPVLDTVVMSSATGAYLSQSDKGELVMGGALDLYPSFSQRASLPTLEGVMAGVIDLFPTASRARMLRSWGGSVDVVYDSSPILGGCAVEGLILNCGWGTGGFKAIPAGGALTAEHVATGRPSEIARPFGLDRFTTGAFLDEGAASGIAH